MLKYDQTLLRSSAILLLCITASACSYNYKRDSAPKHHVNVANIPDAVPQVEDRSAGGNPASYKVFGKTYYVMNSAKGYSERGVASWYGTAFHGKKTSNGETYSMYKMTAAHKTLPIPTYLQVTNLQNNRSVIVRVNDRGPFAHNRILDLSYVAAKKLGIADAGTGFVEIRALDPKTWKNPPKQTPSISIIKKAQAAEDFKNLYIQAGAFASQHNASQLKKQLHVLFPQKSVQLAHNAQDQLYRVRIGPIANVKEADRIAKTISDNGHPTPKVIFE